MLLIDGGVLSCLLSDDEDGSMWFFFSSRRRHTRFDCDWSSDVCSSDLKKFKSDHMFKSLRTEDPLEVMKRIWAMATMEVHGVIGGYSGPGIKTIIPLYAA